MPIRSHALFRLLSTPPGDAAKGGDYIYGDTGPCIDTGVLIEYEGDLCISLTALREMCEVAGFSFNTEALQLEAEVEHLRAENARLIEENAAANEQLEAIGVAIARAAKS